jgi:hypothetical protein
MHNRRSCEYCHVNHERETLGKTDYDFFSKERAALYVQGDQEVMRNGKPIINAIAPAPENSDQMIVYSKVPVYGKNRKIIGVAGIHRIVEGLRGTPDTRALWPHAFELTLQITVGTTLRLALTTRNMGDAPFQITQALHSYLAVADIAQATVTGLGGCNYIDNATGAQGAVRQQVGGVRFEAEVDRIYTGAPAELALVDGARQRQLRISSAGSRTAVVWNPGAALAARMADLSDGDHRRFVCVETAHAADEVVTVPPGEEHRLVATLGLQAGR